MRMQVRSAVGHIPRFGIAERFIELHPTSGSVLIAFARNGRTFRLVSPGDSRVWGVSLSNATIYLGERVNLGR